MYYVSPREGAIGPAPRPPSAPLPASPLDRITRLAARSLGVPIAILSTETGGALRVRSTAGIDRPAEDDAVLVLCRHVAESGAPLAVDDLREYPLTREAAAQCPLGATAYLGVPIPGPSGEALGALCVLDRSPRRWSEEDRDALGDVGALLARELAHGDALSRLGDELGDERRAHAATRALSRAALDALPDVFFVVGTDGRLLHWNRRTCDVSGYSDAELPTLTAADFFVEADRPLILEAIAKTYRTGQARIEARTRTKAGEVVPYEFTAALLLRDDGTPLGVCGIGRDVAERRAIEADRDASERRFRSFVEATAQVVWRADADGHITEIGDTWARFTGQGPEESAGWGWADAVHPDDAPGLMVAWSVHLEAQHPYATEYRVRRHDGAYHRFSVRAVPVFDDGGAFVEWIGTCTDVERERRAEEAVARSERLLRSTLNALSAHIAVLDADGVIVEVNEAWRAFALANGADPAAVGAGADYVAACEHDDEDGAIVARALRSVLAGERAAFELEYPCHGPDTPRWFQLHVSRFGHGAATRVVVAHENVTAIRLAREALRESEERLQLALDSAEMGTWDRDLRTDVVHYSPRTQALYGLPDGSTSLDEVLSRIEPSFHSAVRDALDRSVAAGRPFTTEFQRSEPGADGPRWIRATGRPTYDAHGEPVRMTGTVRDVTESKRAEAAIVRAMAEAEAAREEAEEAARMKTALLTNMSHEIRTPLTGILGFADLLAAEVEEGAHREFLLLIRESGHRLLHTLDAVLDLAQLEAGRHHLDLAPVDLAAAARDAAAFYEPQAEQKGLALRCDLPDAPLYALADEAAVQRIVANLLSNALKFTDAGHVNVSVRPTDDGTAVALVVEDTGIGIADESIGRLFDDFRQESEGETRDYEGAGLGLSITQRLVRMIGGTVSVESTKGVGSTFTVLLPLAEAGA